MKFAYKRLSNGVQRPVIPITIRNPRTDQSVRHFALVDSGADLSIFSSEIADLISIDLAAGMRKNISGVVAGEPPVLLAPSQNRSWWQRQANQDCVHARLIRK
jgi:hypothetical protein